MYPFINISRSSKYLVVSASIKGGLLLKVWDQYLNLAIQLNQKNAKALKGVLYDMIVLEKENSSSLVEYSLDTTMTRSFHFSLEKASLEFFKLTLRLETGGQIEMMLRVQEVDDIFAFVLGIL